MIASKPYLQTFRFNIVKALKSMSTLNTLFAWRYAHAIDNLPVPAPKSKINLFLISLNSTPAKKTMSTALFASMQYCSNLILGFENPSVC